MKLRSLVPNFYIHVSGNNLYIPHSWSYFEISIILHCMRELSAQPQEQREGQGTSAKQRLAASSLPKFPALLSTPVVETRVHIIDQNSNLQFGKLPNPCSKLLIWFESEWDSKKEIPNLYRILTGPSFAVYVTLLSRLITVLHAYLAACSVCTRERRTSWALDPCSLPLLWSFPTKRVWKPCSKPQLGWLTSVLAY